MSKESHYDYMPRSHIQTTFVAPDEIGMATDLAQLRLLIGGMLEKHRLKICRPPDALPRLCSPEDVARLLLVEMQSLLQEELRVLLMAHDCKVLDIVTVYRGCLGSIPFRAAEVFRPAILINAPAIILVHNHPHGISSPSKEDLQFYDTLTRSGDILGIRIVDFIIVGQEGYSSLKAGFPNYLL